MKFKSIISTITLLCLLFWQAAYTKKLLEAFKQDVYTPEYATDSRYWAQRMPKAPWYKYPTRGKEPKCNNVLLHLPQWWALPHRIHLDDHPAGAQHIVCRSSSYIAMLDALGQVDCIVAVSGINYIAPIPILAHKDSIKDMGPEINYELLLGLKLTSYCYMASVMPRQQ